MKLNDPVPFDPVALRRVAVCGPRRCRSIALLLCFHPEATCGPTILSMCLLGLFVLSQFKTTPSAPLAFLRVPVHAGWGSRSLCLLHVWPCCQKPTPTASPV